MASITNFRTFKKPTKVRKLNPKNTYLDFEPKGNGNPLATAIIILAIICVIWGIYFFITL